MTQSDEKFAAVPAHLQAELLRRLAGESVSEDRPIPPAPRDGLLPMSSGQERLWFAAELEPDSAEYNTLRALRLRGELDTAALAAALDQVVSRHEMLRTTFDSVEGRGVQVVHEHVDRPLPTIDVSGPDARATVERFLSEDLNKPFDLRRGPLLRAALLRVEDREHVLVLAMHHIVCDGWSTGRLLGEVATAYDVAVGGVAASLPPMPVQFADFAVWERERADALDEQLDYWRERLAGMRTADLPTDRPRPPVRTSAGETLPVEIPADVLGRLRELSRGQDATLFMALVTVTKVLLARYCGEPDVAVGTVTLGRQRPELENLIGSFINTVVLRSQVEESLPFTEQLGRVRTGLLEAFAHDEVPFQRLVDTLRPERDASRPPLVQVMVNLQNMADTLPDFRGLEVSEIQPPVDVAKLDLTFDFYEDAASLVCYLEYSTDLFDRATVERLGGHLVTLLRAVSEQPSAPLAELSMLPADELRVLTDDWQGLALPAPAAAQTLHQIFDAQAARTPDSVAVSDGSRRLTFAELDARANRLAHHLVAAGVRPGVLTGVCLDRTVDAMVALLAVLKAGGAFVPLDPEHPAQRLSMMLGDAAAPVLVTDSAAAGEGDWTTVRLDTDQDAIARHPATPPTTAVGPDDLAYVVYTSGSTGRPKGVMVSHRNAVHMMRAWDARYGLSELKGRSLSVSSLAVDLFLGDFLMSAMYGGEMVICPAEVITDPPALAALIAGVRPQLLVTTPSLAKAVAQELSWTGGRADSLRVLAVGSEAWLADDAAAVLELLLPDAVVTNNYGATETTVDSTTYQLRAGAPVGAAVVPVGRPLGNTRTYVLDALLRPVPVGVPGEIHIGGDGVAQGYWNRPDLTEQRFHTDPFTGGRLYRTGDIGRWRADGNLEYLGRADDQVKVRGFRVELGEVEAAMLRHTGIAAAAAAVRPDSAGRDRLVGYLVADGDAPTLTELRAFLAGIVPDPAIPSALVVLDELPMTSSGTLDRKALPAPAATDHPAGNHVAPRNDTESALVAIWAEVLGLEPGTVGVDDNFFELGGDSIVGLQVVSKARRAGLRLTAKQIFLHQTVADLAAVVQVADRPAPQAAATAAVGDVPLTPVQHWYFEQYPEGAVHFNQSLFVELAPGTDPAVLRTAVTALLDHHDALRLRAVPTDGVWRQHCALTETGEAFRSVDLSDLDESARERAVREAVTAAQTGFRLDTGPLLGAVLFTGAPGPDRLFLTAHHLVVDGVTWRVLLADLELAHEQAAQGLRVTLPEKSTGFRDWSCRLTEAAAAGRFAEERPYWQAVEAASAACAPLPVDRTGPDTLAHARTVEAGLDAELTRALLRDVPAAYRTQVNDVLLTALAVVLAEWTGGEGVAVELEGHGRENLFEDVDLSRTAGWFTTLFPVVLPVPGEDWGDRLKAVKETLRAVPEAGIGYGALRYLTGDAGLEGARSQVGFNYHGTFDVATGEGLLRGWQPSPAPDRSADLARPNLLEITGMVRDGRLEFSWEFSEALHDEATIAGLAARFTAALAEIVAHCATAGGCTPSDFPLAGLDQAGVDRIAGDGTAIEDIYPLTPMQSGLLFHSLDAHEDDIYFTHAGLVLDGVTDSALLAEAWQRVVDRTPVLRTAIADAEGGRPLQVIHKEATVPVTFEDWSELTEEEQQERIRLLAETPAAPLDLSKPPLLRLHIARLSATTVHLRCSSHHLLLDGWSFADVLGDVFAEHAALSGRDVEPPRPRRPFREYVRWLGEQDTAAAQAYWTAQLEGFSAPTALPYDRTPLRSHQSRDTGFLNLVFTAEETARLERFARDTRVTVNTVIQGAWALLLSRYSGDRHVCFGTTVGGRPADLPGSDEMVGLLINTLPARVKVTPDTELRSWLRQIQEQQLDGRQFEYVSLAQVRNWAGIPAGTDLFESCVVFENFPYDENAAERYGLGVESLVGLETSNFPLTCVAHLVDGLHMRLGYDPRLFDDATAARFADHLVGMLDAMAAAPGGALRDLPTVRGAERHRLIEEFNGAPSGYPEACLHELFAEVARTHPHRPAVVASDTRLSYAELDAHSDRLAHDLVGRGVGPEVPVGICLPGGAEMITAMLGVLKAGGVCVPLDPGYPAERLDYLFRDSGVPVLFTSAALAPGLPPTDAEIVLADDLLAQEPDPATAVGPPPSRTDPDNLAVLVYTSGSTGSPKAGMVTHRGLVRLVHASGEHTFGNAATIAQHHSISFDAAQNELWQALLNGACLAVRPGDFRSVDELDKFLRDNEVEAMSFAAGFFHAVADTDPGILAGLRRVVVGGEALSAPHCARVLDRLPDLQLVNAYGPTECAVTATCFPVERGQQPGRTVPVGRPTGDTRVYLLDQDLQVVPVGVAGEAYLAGPGVCRGYRDRPAMTAGRFLPDPFGPPGSRMYRTGDLMRWSADGTLEFVGRTDDQVKLRGYRIELGEIEQALSRHPDVAGAAVVVREDQPGRRRLVGYVVSEREPAELGAYLAALLPEYMVPSAFVPMEQIPLTAHGKVDRRALPEPATAADGQDSVEPRTADERTMAGVWAEVLGLERVGVTDDFFDLGGDSILSIQVVFKSRRAGLQISSSDLFRHPTIEQLVTAAGQERRIAATQEAETGEVPLTAIQHEFFARNTVAPQHFVQSIHVELAADLDEAALRAALQAVVAHHDALRMRYTRDEQGTWSQRNAAAETGELIERHDLSGLSGEELAEAMNRHAAAADRSFDLAAGPLLRAVLFDLGQDRRAHLHLTVHHLVIDAVSWRIINHDLDLAYQQALDGEAIDLGEKTSSFRQWSTRLAEHTADGGFADQAAHWDAVPEPAPLPADGPGPNVVSSRRIVPVRLERAETAALLHVAPGRFRARVSDVLLAALAWTMSRWSGDEQPVIEMEGHGREEIFDDVDLSRTVGWFTSSYPVALKVPGGTEDAADWPAVVKSVRRCLRAVPGNGLGYGPLRHFAGDTPAAEHAPPAVLFNYHSQTEEITQTADRSLFHAFHDPIGEEQDDRERVVQALEVVGAVEGGRLGFDLYYSVNLHEPETIERVGSAFVAALRSIAHLCEPTLGTEDAR